MDITSLFKMDFTSLLIQIVVAAIILAPVLWIVGKFFVGSDKAKFTDALWIGVLGVLIEAFFGFLAQVGFLIGWIGSVLGILAMIIVWLGLIQAFFDCGLLKASVIAVIGGIIYLVISLILSAILVMLGFPALPSLW